MADRDYDRDYNRDYYPDYDRDDDRYDRNRWRSAPAGRDYYGTGRARGNRYGYARDYENDWGDRGRFGRNQGYDRDYDSWSRGRYGYPRDYDSDHDYGTTWGRDYNRYGYGSTYDYGRGYDDSPAWTYSESWFIPGPFTGQGPGDFQRSDERIREDANERLTRHGGLDASNITVKVQGSEITLEGTVDSRRDKRMAEDAVDDVWGVKDVHNHLKIDRSQNKDKQASRH